MAWTRALVTGGSSGIGRCFAERLAQRGTDLVLIARSEQELGTATCDLASRHGVSAEPLVADLTDVADLQRVDTRLRDDSRPVDLLVNNAGFSSVGHAADLPLEQEDEMLRLNALAVLHLTRSGAEAMRARGGGTVLNVASLAGYAPIPFFRLRRRPGPYRGRQGTGRRPARVCDHPRRHYGPAGTTNRHRLVGSSGRAVACRIGPARRHRASQAQALQPDPHGRSVAVPPLTLATVVRFTHPAAGRAKQSPPPQPSSRGSPTYFFRSK